MRHQASLACDLRFAESNAYIGECRPGATGPWVQFYEGNSSSCTATGLNPGQMYYFRMRAVGPLGPGPWSDIAQKRAS